MKLKKYYYDAKTYEKINTSIKKYVDLNSIETLLVESIKSKRASASEKDESDSEQIKEGLDSEDDEEETEDQRVDKFVTKTFELSNIILKKVLSKYIFNSSPIKLHGDDSYKSSYNDIDFDKENLEQKPFIVYQTTILNDIVNNRLLNAMKEVNKDEECEKKFKFDSD